MYMYIAISYNALHWSFIIELKLKKSDTELK